MGNAISNQFYGNCENLNFHNIIDVNGIVRCATNLKGLASTSASPSDLLLFDFPPHSHYNGE